MNQERIISLVNRVLFVGAFVLFAVAVLEKVANMQQQTLIGTSYTPGRLFEFSAITLLFVITLTVRSIRETMKDRS